YSFMDYFGPGARVKLQTYFDYGQERHFAIEDSKLGVDFALMLLRELFQKGFAANEIEPFDRKHWVGSDDPEYEFYGMLGIPSDLVEPLSRQGEKVSQVGAMISVTFVQISKLAALPSGVDALPGNWFLGKVDTPFSIAGMSGAP